MAYADIKREIDRKTKLLVETDLPEKKKEAINIDLERVRIYITANDHY